MKKEKAVLCSVKGCNEIALALSDTCWDHLQSREEYTKKLLNAIASHKSIAGLNLKKITLKKYHIEKADFRRTNLSQADLSHSHFFDCNFTEADMVGVKMTGCDAVHCSFDGSDMTHADLTGSRLWNSNLSNANLSESDISSADFQNAKLYNVKLWHANLVGARFLKKTTFSKTRSFLESPKINESGLIAAEESYREIKRYFIENGMYNDASWASYKEKTIERMILKKNASIGYLPSLLMGMLCGYGEKPYRIVLSSLFTILIFSLAYFSFNAIIMTGNPAYMLRWVDCLYYSTITFTTVGYGDFVPAAYTPFRLLAAAEAFMGVFLTGLFIFTLARKYSAR